MFTCCALSVHQRVVQGILWEMATGMEGCCGIYRCQRDSDLFPVQHQFPSRAQPGRAPLSRNVSRIFDPPPANIVPRSLDVCEALKVKRKKFHDLDKNLQKILRIQICRYICGQKLSFHDNE